jgi:hypothetical protein
MFFEMFLVAGAVYGYRRIVKRPPAFKPLRRGRHPLLLARKRLDCLEKN